MTDRFLEYSLRHGRKIKAMWLESEEIKQCNIAVKEIKGDVVYCIIANSKKLYALQKQQFLSLGYARGDSGEII